MKNRNLRNNYKYGIILDEKSEMLRQELYTRIGLKKIFKNKKVLDLGCGYGSDSVNFSKFAKKVVGLDIDFHEEWRNIKKKKTVFVKGDSSSLPFKDDEFDCVFLKDLLHHVKNIEKTLQEIKRVTKKEGKIIVLEGNRYNPIFYIYSTKIRGHDHFTQKEFEKIIFKFYKKTHFLHIEVYPPFNLPKKVYRWLLKIGRRVDGIVIFKKIRSYNVAICEVD